MIPHHFFPTILLFLSFSATSIANNPVQEILDNPDIVWAAEVNTIYAPNMHHFDQFTADWVQGANAASILKIQNNIGDNWLEFPSTLANYVLNLKEDNINLYSDSELNQRISFKHYNSITTSSDTIETFDPETFEKINQIVITKHSHRDIKIFKVRQILFYNIKNHRFGLTPIAIAPILEGKSLFWMPINELKKALDLNSSSIIWAARMLRDIHQKDLKLIKGKQSLGDMTLDLMGYASIAPEFAKLYSTLEPLEEMLVESIKNINTGETEITAADITQIRVVQDWYWDDKAQKMSVLLLFYAPVVRYNDAVNPKELDRPFFYQKP